MSLSWYLFGSLFGFFLNISTIFRLLSLDQVSSTINDIWPNTFSYPSSLDHPTLFGSIRPFQWSIYGKFNNVSDLPAITTFDDFTILWDDWLVDNESASILKSGWCDRSIDVTNLVTMCYLHYSSEKLHDTKSKI